MTDPIADLLTRIRNALMRSKETVNAPYSKLKHELAKLLVKEGFLHSVKKSACPFGHIWFWSVFLFCFGYIFEIGVN